MWKFYAVLSAFFAALTAIFAKMGVKGVDSNLATAIRTTVILFIAWGVVLLWGREESIRELSRRAILFLVLSGVTTGLSWLFYFKALQSGPVSKVAPVDKLSVAMALLLAFFLLRETPDVKTIVGIAHCRWFGSDPFLNEGHRAGKRKGRSFQLRPFRLPALC